MTNQTINASPIVLVTGVAGFIGSYVARGLLSQGVPVVGIDNMCDYYDVQLKRDRLRFLCESDIFQFAELDLLDLDGLKSLFSEHQLKYVINMAAQAGVRYSIDNPHAYVSSNLIGFHNLLECCRMVQTEHLLFASSSSVYGNKDEGPFHEDMRTDHPVSFYAATKKSNEVMAYSYASLYNLRITGVRLFTVYGPWGRPDMAPMIFLNKIMAGDTIHVFNQGQMMRDFTYINDVVSGIYALLDMNGELSKMDRTSQPFYQNNMEVFNIGSGNPVKLMHFIQALEELTQKKAMIHFEPMQDGDVKKTHASISKLHNYCNLMPKTSLEDGLRAFCTWHRQYHHSDDTVIE